MDRPIDLEATDIFDRNTENIHFLALAVQQDLRASLKTSFEGKLAGYAVCVVKPPRKAYSLASSAFLAADAPCRFSMFKPVFREALNITSFCVLFIKLYHYSIFLSTDKCPTETNCRHNCKICTFYAFFLNTFHLSANGAEIYALKRAFTISFYPFAAIANIL